MDHTAVGTQILTLTGLRFDANLGILSHEKTDPQPIQVDAELSLGVQPLTPRDDDILHVLDYRKVRQIIIDECRAEHVNLLDRQTGQPADATARRAGRAREDRQAGDLRRLRSGDPHRDRAVVTAPSTRPQ
jgi:dihydroneopterin aldolase